MGDREPLTPSPWEAEPLRAISFDVTGTLIHAPALGEIYSEVLSRHGIAVEPAEARRLIHQVWEELDCLARPDRDRFAAHPGGARGFWSRFLARFCEHLRVAPPTPFAVSELFERFALPDSWAVFPDVAPALDMLAARGLKLAVISNWDERLPRLLRGLGIEERLSTVVFSSAIGVEKPHPEIFLAGVRALELPPASVLHVGDRRRHDYEGAVAIGMRSAHLDRRGEDGDLANLGELAGWVDRERLGDSVF